MTVIDTHAHLDGEEFREDLPAVIDRAQKAGVKKVIVPTINLDNLPIKVIAIPWLDCSLKRWMSTGMRCYAK